MSMHPVATAAADETDARWSRMAIRTLARLAGFAPGATDAIRTTTTSQLKELETEMNVQTEVKTVDNGVNVEALLGARAALTETAGSRPVHVARDAANGSMACTARRRSRASSASATSRRTMPASSFEADHPESLRRAGQRGDPGRDRALGPGELPHRRRRRRRPAPRHPAPLGQRDGRG